MRSGVMAGGQSRAHKFLSGFEGSKFTTTPCLTVASSMGWGWMGDNDRAILRGPHFPCLYGCTSKGEQDETPSICSAPHADERQLVGL